MIASQQDPLLDRWRRCIRRRASHGRRPLAALGYLFDGPVLGGLVELERLTLVVLYDEPLRHDQCALRLAGYTGTQVPWGVMWGGPEQCRFFKDLSLQPVPQGRGLRLDLARPRLLRMGLQLADERDRHSCHPSLPCRNQFRLPCLWAAFTPAHAAGLYGDGPELAAYARRVQKDANEVFSTVCRRHVGLSLHPLAWVSHHADFVATIFVDLARFPKRQVIALDDLPGKLVGLPGCRRVRFSAKPLSSRGPAGPQIGGGVTAIAATRTWTEHSFSPSISGDTALRLMYINNNGSGYADYIEVAEGTTVEALFAQRVPGGNPHDYLIRVNRQPATADQVLCEGDRVSVTPVKIEGAAGVACSRLLGPASASWRWRAAARFSPLAPGGPHDPDPKDGPPCRPIDSPADRRALALARPYRFSRRVLEQPASAPAADRTAPGTAVGTPRPGSSPQISRAKWSTAANAWRSSAASCNSRSPKHLPTESEIFREILAVQDEFGEVEIDLAEGELAITTDPIVLDDTHLGPFQIRLDIGRLAGRQPYRVVALEPNPAAANEAVTHPHVQDERLCEGDGRAAIESALNAGRLCDFFLIVSRLLGTYARGSAYIELSAWLGIRCQDCGSLTYDDDRCHCDRCDADLCGECCLSCHGCERGLCSDCMSTCQCCGEHYCQHLPDGLPGLPRKLLRKLPRRWPL